MGALSGKNTGPPGGGIVAQSTDIFITARSRISAAVNASKPELRSGLAVSQA